MGRPFLERIFPSIHFFFILKEEEQHSKEEEENESAWGDDQARAPTKHLKVPLELPYPSASVGRRLVVR